MAENGALFSYGVIDVFHIIWRRDILLFVPDFVIINGKFYENIRAVRDMVVTRYVTLKIARTNYV